MCFVKLKVNHPVIHRVDDEIFRATFAADCMQHQCLCRDESDRPRADACCQYGADLLTTDKAAILRRAAQIAAVLKPERRDTSQWFDEREPGIDPTVPDGIILRTATSDQDNETSGCIFLEHTGERGCGLHRTALLNGFAPAEIKPSACRLYPLYWDNQLLELSPEFQSYSCADDAGPKVYRLMREVIAETFGAALVDELDRLELKVASRRLPLAVSLAR
jgi:Fe-S-cluster containining protein